MKKRTILEIETEKSKSTKFIGLLGIFMPLINLRVNIINIYDMSLFMGATIIFGIIQFIKRILKEKQISFRIQIVDLLIFILFVYMIFSLLFSIDKNIGIEKIIKFAILLILFYLSRMIFLNKHNIQQVIKYCIITCSAYIVYLSFYYLIVYNKLYIGMDIVSASKSGRNSLALVLLLILSFAIGVFLETQNKRGKRHILPFLAVLISGLLLLQSRGAMVTIVMSLVFTTVLYKTKTKNLKKSIFTMIIIFAVILIIIPDELRSQIWYRVQSIFLVFNDNIQNTEGIGSINARKALISISFEAIKQNPIFGIGIGSFRSFSFTTYTSPHNDYLYFAAEFGLIGLFLYVYLLISIYRMASLNYKSEKTPYNRALLIAITSICIYSAFINAYDNFLIWSVYAMICATYSRLRQKKFPTSISREEGEST